LLVAVEHEATGETQLIGQCPRRWTAAQPSSPRCGVEAHSYVHLQCMDDDREGSHLRRYWRGHYLRVLDDAAIEAFVARGVEPGDDGTDDVLVPGHGAVAEGPEVAARLAADRAYIDALR
jgi:hypothetical protein